MNIPDNHTFGALGIGAWPRLSRCCRASVIGQQPASSGTAVSGASMGAAAVTFYGSPDSRDLVWAC